MHQENTLLSPRELTVARLVADGKTNKEIAQDAGLKPSTVKDYIANACHKLGLSGRVALATWYVKTHGAEA
jgi:DNA-binding CsgD family transcriptional regulator